MPDASKALDTAVLDRTLRKPTVAETVKLELLRQWWVSGGFDALHQRATTAEAALAAERAQKDRLAEAFKDAAAHLIGAASAYRKHAARHRSVGRAAPDALFTARASDFDKAAERAHQNVAALAHPASDAAPAAADDAVRVALERICLWKDAIREPNRNLGGLYVAMLAGIDALAAQPEAAHDR